MAAYLLARLCDTVEGRRWAGEQVQWTKEKWAKRSHAVLIVSVMALGANSGILPDLFAPILQFDSFQGFAMVGSLLRVVIAEQCIRQKQRLLGFKTESTYIRMVLAYG